MFCTREAEWNHFKKGKLVQLFSELEHIRHMIPVVTFLMMFQTSNNDGSNLSVVFSIPDRLQIAGGNNVAGNGAPVNYSSDSRAHP